MSVAMMVVAICGNGTDDYVSDVNVNVHIVMLIAINC